LTRIYHIVHFSDNNSIYIFFRGCNFRCTGCILKSSPWDCHLTDRIRCRLQSLSSVEELSLDSMQRIVEPLCTESAVLGGGEPTTDPQLTDVIRLLRGLKVRTALLTNGYALNENKIEELRDAGLDEVCVSIKAIKDALHIPYTGKSNKRVLRNFKLLSKSGMPIKAESVLIPQLIEQDEIKTIASFIASVDPSIHYRVDAYVPVPGASWRQPSEEEVSQAVEQANEHLENVSYIWKGTELKGNVANVYPPLQHESR